MSTDPTEGPKPPPETLGDYVDTGECPDCRGERVVEVEEYNPNPPALADTGPGGGLLSYATDAECIAACLQEIARLQEERTSLWKAAEDALIHHSMGWEMEDVMIALDQTWRAIPRPADLESTT